MDREFRNKLARRKKVVESFITFNELEIILTELDDETMIHGKIDAPGILAKRYIFYETRKEIIEFLRKYYRFPEAVSCVIRHQTFLRNNEKHYIDLVAIPNDLRFPRRAELYFFK